MTPEIKQRIEQIQNGKVPKGYKQTSEGIVPSNWRTIKLGDVFKERTEKNNKDLQLLSITSTKGVIPRSKIDKKDNSSKDKSNYLRICKGDIGYNTMRMWQGVSALSQYEGIISPAYTVLIPSNKISKEYFSYLFKTEPVIFKFYRYSQGLVDDTRNLKYNSFKNIRVSVPPIEEQEIIAKILTTQDKLIECYEKKIEQLKRIKKYYLQNMFPKHGETVPKIRFKGFTEPWEQRKLGECFVFMQNNTLSRAELQSERGAAINIHYGDVLIKYGEYLDIALESMSYTPNQSIVDKLKGSLLADGDIIMADTAEDETVGKCSEIAGLQGKAALSGLHTIPLRPKEKYESGFLGYYMNSGAYHNQLLPLMQGIKVTSISKSDVKGTEISYPQEKSEQASIGRFFIQLDNLITLHQRKCEKEKKKKKALQQLLLTGIVRVKL